MDRVPFNRSALNATANGLAGRERGVGAGNSASWMTPDGNTIVDLTPETYLARLTGERIGAAYGWERVHVDCDSAGNIIVGLWTDGDANSGTPTALPAIEPNGSTKLQEGAIVKIWPCEQGGTWKYYIMGMVGRNRLSIPVAYCDENEELAYYYICLEGDFSWSIGPCEGGSSSSSSSGA